MNRVPGVTVTPYVDPGTMVAVFDLLNRYHGKIQDKDDDYYMQFNLVVCGLDSVEARRWMNATLINMVDEEVPESVKPLIDGGTEGTSYFTIHIHPHSCHATRISRSSPCNHSQEVIMLRVLP
jgi:molybdopterin/thiamine biosynthesis adenylyltransferase